MHLKQDIDSITILNINGIDCRCIIVVGISKSDV